MRKNWENDIYRPSILNIAENVRNLYSSEFDVDDEYVESLCRRAVSDDPDFSDFSFEQREKIIRQTFCSLRCELEILQDIADCI